ncbi:MAG: hypothetical protein JSV87_04935 [Candidatus Bathyarchaeota archaeon]|nr:MAG: hypothetical protein JSV87_04935 [Candidatus Bathyarchaeota archaeon]
MVRAVPKLAFISFLMGFLILLEQAVVYGAWFEIHDVHHETFAVALFSLGFGIILGLISRNRKT